MRYADPELEAAVQAWEESAKQPPLMSQRGAHMLRAPRPLMNCLYCHQNLSGKASAVQTLGVLRGRFWRWHKCPFCEERFVAGVAIAQTRYAVGSEIVHSVPLPTSTTDVERMFKWYPRAVYRLMREAEDAQLQALDAAPAIEHELASPGTSAPAGPAPSDLLVDPENDETIDRALMGKRTPSVLDPADYPPEEENTDD